MGNEGVQTIILVVQKSTKKVQTFETKKFEFCVIGGATISQAPPGYFSKLREMEGGTKNLKSGTKQYKTSTNVSSQKF